MRYNLRLGRQSMLFKGAGTGPPFGGKAKKKRHARQESNLFRMSSTFQCPKTATQTRNNYCIHLLCILKHKQPASSAY